MQIYTVPAIRRAEDLRMVSAYAFTQAVPIDGAPAEPHVYSTDCVRGGLRW
jgi:hypothetical protein